MDATSTPSEALPATPRRVSSTRDVEQKSDEELMLAYQGGDASAFRTLLERHEKPVYRFCLRSLGNKDAAADATQEVFLRLVKNALRWEEKAKFTTFLYTIARNFCIDEVRKRNFRKTDSLNTPVGKNGDSSVERQDLVADERPSADRLEDSGRIRTVVNTALATLPDEQRDVFCLRQYSGLSFKEIADTVGVNENTVKSRMRYALETLRKALLTAGFAGDTS